ncbi:unnamed protein product [Rhodiola kirilowii]
MDFACSEFTRDLEAWLQFEDQILKTVANVCGFFKKLNK